MGEKPGAKHIDMQPLTCLDCLVQPKEPQVGPAGKDGFQVTYLLLESFQASDFNAKMLLS